MKSVILDMETLEERLRYWQNRLGLRDWGIEIMFDRGYNLGEYTAKIHMKEDSRRARIRMLEASDYDPDSILPYDMEQVLVHELLHIHFYPLTRDVGDNIAEEQAIEAISRALINLERRFEDMESFYENELAKRPYGLLSSGPQIVGVEANKQLTLVIKNGALVVAQEGEADE